MYQIQRYENTKKMENGIDHLVMYLSAAQYHFNYCDAINWKLAPLTKNIINHHHTGSADGYFNWSIAQKSWELAI